MDNMRIFDTFEQGKNRAKNNSARVKGKNVKAERPERLRLSADEIRNRVATKAKHQEVEKKNKEMSGQKLGMGFLDEGIKAKVDLTAKSLNKASQKKNDPAKTIGNKKPMIKPEAKIEPEVKAEAAHTVVKSLDPKKQAESEEVIGDVSKNDPNDPNTKEKLKSVLAMGAFSFSEKEKAALGKILGQ
ncbi:hypothetical protein OAT67_07085 [Bacteriovoracaceae bacterium]|nr:hypothetical protein [Bacteriovoracaceae bacterium]